MQPQLEYNTYDRRGNTELRDILSKGRYITINVGEDGKVEIDEIHGRYIHESLKELLLKWAKDLGNSRVKLPNVEGFYKTEIDGKIVLYKSHTNGIGRKIVCYIIDKDIDTRIMLINMMQKSLMGML